MTPGRIEIEIGEVLLDGFGPLDREAVGLAMQAELTRLADGRPGLVHVPVSRFEVATSDGGEIRLRVDYDSPRIGATVAQAAFRAMSNALQGRTAR